MDKISIIAYCENCNYRTKHEPVLVNEKNSQQAMYLKCTECNWTYTVKDCLDEWSDMLGMCICDLCNERRETEVEEINLRNYELSKYPNYN